MLITNCVIMTCTAVHISNIVVIYYSTFVPLLTTEATFCIAVTVPHTTRYLCH